jgi:PIN domain nuclease of toxin-antitoxin system
MAETGCVLDTSALLALFLEEPGAAAVRAALPGATLSAVTVAEVVGVLLRRGVPEPRAEAFLPELSLPVVPFDTSQALIAARLDPLTHRRDISFADRCCIAVGRHLRLPVLTADRPWASLDLGVEVRLIR